MSTRGDRGTPQRNTGALAPDGGMRAGIACLLALLLVLPSAGPARADATPPTRATGGLLITHVNLLTMTGPAPRVLVDHEVLVRGNRIVRIGPAGATPDTGVRVVQGEGRFLLPGLIDAHVHVWDYPELAAYLAFGVTAVRNASGMPFHLDYAGRIAEGTLVGPRLITTGPILNGQGPNTQPNHQIVGDATQARAAVRRQFQQGYRHLKVYSNLSRQAYEAIVDESKRLGMTLMGHTPEGVREPGIPQQRPFNIAFEELLDDGFVSIEHMESIVWHALADELDEARIRKLAGDIMRNSTPVTPTLLAHHNLVMVARTQGSYLQRPGVEMLNPFITSLEGNAYTFWSAQPPASRDAEDAFYLRATGIFQEAGVTLLAGTDAGIFTNIPGQSLIDELQLLVQAGLTPYQALRTATANPGRVLGFGVKLGQIRVGYAADLILVEDDPTQDIRALESPAGVLADGRWYDAAALAGLLEQAVQTSLERTRRQVLESLSQQ